MSEHSWVGLDVHVESITAAILEGESDNAEVLRLSGNLHKVRRLFRRLSMRGPVRACYKASGSGFVLHRRLKQDGFLCEVIAPSLIPRKPGDRRKFDRLDAVMLARLYRNGHLTPVDVPTEGQEAVRRIVRLRNAYQRQCKASKLRICAVLFSHGLVYRKRKSLRWHQSIPLSPGTHGLLRTRTHRAFQWGP